MFKNQKVIAIIPAKKNSMSLKNKNILVTLLNDYAKTVFLYGGRDDEESEKVIDAEEE